VHRTTSLPPSDVRQIRRVPSTAVSRTLIDLAAEPGVVDDRLADAVDSALRDGLVTEHVLRGRMALLRGSGRDGIRRLETAARRST
jgi:hypothetical protein